MDMVEIFLDLQKARIKMEGSLKRIEGHLSDIGSTIDTGFGEILKILKDKKAKRLT